MTDHYTAYHYILPAWSLPYLINGDDSNCSDSESEQVKQFEQKVLADVGQGHWDIKEPEPSFRHDNDVDGLGGDAYFAHYIVFR